MPAALPQHPSWIHSSHSTVTNCVEAAQVAPGRIAVRDSKHLPGPLLQFGARTWELFLRTVKGSGPA